MGKLVNHIGSGFAGEIESSLNILADLVRDEILAMTRFAAYLKVIILKNFTAAKNRQNH